MNLKWLNLWAVDFDGKKEMNIDATAMQTP